MFGFGTCCLLRRRAFRFCSRRDQRSRDCNGFGALPDKLSTDCMRTDFGYLTRLSSRPGDTPRVRLRCRRSTK